MAPGFTLPRVVDAADLPLTGNVMADARLQQIQRDGSGERSESLLMASIEADPHNWLAYVALAHLHQNRLHMKAAELILQRALELAPNHPLVLGELAQVYLHWVNAPWLKATAPPDALARAAYLLQNAQAQAPEDGLLAVYQAQYALLAHKDVTLARQHLTRGLKQAGNHIPLLLMAADLHVQMGHSQQARELLFFVYDLAPERPSVLDALARLMAREDHPQKAITYTQRAIGLDGGTVPERDLLLAQQYEKLADTAQALHYYGRFSDYVKNDVGLTLKQAGLLEHAGFALQAQQMFQQAYALDAGLFHQSLQEAMTLLNREALQEAKPALQKAHRLNPDAPVFPGLISTLYYRSMLLGVTVPEAEWASARCMVERPLPAPAPQYQFEGVHQQLNATVSPDEATLNRLRFNIAQARGRISPEQSEQLNHLKLYGSSVFVQAEAAFLRSDMGDALGAVEEISTETAVETLQAWGDRWRLMQFLPGAIRLYEMGLKRSPHAEIEHRLHQLRGVNSRIETALAPYFIPPPFSRGGSTGAWIEARNRQRIEAKKQAMTTIELNPCHPKPYVLLGTLASHEKQWADAVFYWQAAISRENPVDSRHLQALELAQHALLRQTPGLDAYSSLPSTQVPASPGYRG
jgi:tetratricopeptide (TPR) repeat protein